MSNPERLNGTPEVSVGGRFSVLISFALLSILLTGCAVVSPPSNSSSRPGTIVSTETQASIDKEKLLAQSSNTDVIYVGEQHTNSGSHDVQFKVIKHLVEAGKSVSVGFELFREKHQALLDEWREGTLTREEFKRRLETTRGNPEVVDYYRDILTLAQRKELNLVALKPDREAVNRVIKDDHGETQSSPGNERNPQERFLKDLFRNHPSTGHGFRSFVRVQQFWENRMAENIHRHLRNSENPRTIVVLTGNLHVLYDFGIPNKLANRGNWSQLSIVTLPVNQSLDEAFSFRNKNNGETVKPADYVWWVEASKKSRK